MDNYSIKILDIFRGKVVRKDLTALMKRGANVPSYVLEYLLGMYCSTDDQDVINVGIKKINNILSTNYVRYDEIEKTKFILTEKGEYTIIDKITARVDEELNLYVGRFSNFDIGEFILEKEYAQKYNKVFTGGVWCMAKIKYDHFTEEEEYDENGEEIVKEKGSIHSNLSKKGKNKKFLNSPYSIIGLKPIQLPAIDIQSILEAREEFTLDEWMILMLRSCGIEGAELNEKERFHFFERLVPLFERNYNLVELGPRGTGKSHIYKEISPYTILISGATTSVSNLFYNVSRKTVGLVGNWDVVAFDEISGFGFKDPVGIQITKDFMASGSFSRGKEVIQADASMVFLGNINDTVENLIKISHLFAPFPEAYRNDSAFFDRMHYYLPGWEVPKIRADYLTEEFGFISDYFAEYAKEMRKEDFTHVFDEWFKLNKNITTRDEIAIRKTVSGLVKILFPNKQYTKEELEQVLVYAIEGRRRVKEQLRKISGDEFADVDLGYITNEGKEVIVNVPERVAGTLITEKNPLPGHVYAIGYSLYHEYPAAYRLESKKILGNGKIEIQGVRGKMRGLVLEALNAGWKYFLEYHQHITKMTNVHLYDYLLYVNDLQRKNLSTEISVAEFISLCSITINKPVSSGLAIIGEITLSGTLKEIKGIEDYLRVAKNAGALKALIPTSCKQQVLKIKDKDIIKVEVLYYNNVVEAAKMALGIED